MTKSLSKDSGKCYRGFHFLFFQLQLTTHHPPIPFLLSCETKGPGDERRRGGNEGREGEEGEFYGKIIFFLFIHIHSPCIYPISFLLSRKECTFRSQRKDGLDEQWERWRKVIFFFSSYSILKYAPCISPISFSLSYELQMKGMNLRFAAIRPRQMGEMEEIGEIVGECYGGSFY